MNYYNCVLAWHKTVTGLAHLVFSVRHPLMSSRRSIDRLRNYTALQTDFEAAHLPADCRSDTLLIVLYAARKGIGECGSVATKMIKQKLLITDFYIIVVLDLAWYDICNGRSVAGALASDNTKNSEIMALLIG